MLSAVLATAKKRKKGRPKDTKAGRRRIKIEFIQDKSRRHITFSKPKAGIIKKVRSLVYFFSV